MRRTPLIGLLTLVAPAPAAAQVQVGERAPELRQASWLGEPPATSLDDLKGSVVALWFFDTDDTSLSGVLANLRRAQSRFGRRGLVLLGLTDDSRGECEEWMETHETTWPIGASCESVSDYNGGTSITDLIYLLDHDGEVVWAGLGYDDAWVRQLGRRLERAEQAWETYDPGDVIAELEKARQHCRRQRFGKAWREAEKVLRRAEGDGEEKVAEEARLLLEGLRADAARRRARAEEHARAGCYHLAYDLLERQVDYFKGSDPGDALRERLKEWRMDRTVKDLRELDEKRVEALDIIYEEGNPGKGLKILRELAEEAAGTPLAKTIADDLEAAQ